MRYIDVLPLASSSMWILDLLRLVLRAPLVCAVLLGVIIIIGVWTKLRGSDSEASDSAASDTGTKDAATVARESSPLAPPQVRFESKRMGSLDAPQVGEGNPVAGVKDEQRG